VVPDLVAEVCGLLGSNPVRDAFATPATREDDAFAQSWDYATAGPRCKSPDQPQGRGGGKRGLGGLLQLILAPEYPGPQYSWWAAVRTLCPKRWQLPQDRALYLRGGGTDLMPAHKWRTWNFLDSPQGSQ